MSAAEILEETTRGPRKPVFGYHVTNPSAPASEPKRVVPINPEQQKKVERLFHKIADAP